MRIDLLNEIGFEWAGEGREKFWNLRYQELVDFHAINGTTRVPEKYEAAPQLQTWVSLQRRQMKMRNLGRPTTLTDERVRLLQAVGLECKIRASTTWMDRFVSRLEDRRSRLLLLPVLIIRPIAFSPTQ